jgi:hypothetical protein
MRIAYQPVAPKREVLQSSGASKKFADAMQEIGMKLPCSLRRPANEWLRMCAAFCASELELAAMLMLLAEQVEKHGEISLDIDLEDEF